MNTKTIISFLGVLCVSIAVCRAATIPEEDGNSREARQYGYGGYGGGGTNIGANGVNNGFGGSHNQFIGASNYGRKRRSVDEALVKEESEREARQYGYGGYGGGGTNFGANGVNNGFGGSHNQFIGTSNYGRKRRSVATTHADEEAHREARQYGYGGYGGGGTNFGANGVNNGFGGSHNSFIGANNYGR